MLPPTLPSGDDVVLNQLKGLLTHAVASASLTQPDRYSVVTPTTTIRPTGTDFTTRYTQTGNIGATVVSVQRGVVEVTDRRAQLTRLTAAMQASFDDAVPRAVLILPVDRASIAGGRVSTFSWTAFPGAEGYLFEYTLNAAGFAQASAVTPEAVGNTIRVLPPSFTVTDGTVEFPVLVPGGILPPGAPGWWRVFPLDGTGQILPGSVGSDAARAFIVQ